MSGTMRRGTVAKLSQNKSTMAAGVWWMRSGARGSSMQRARRSQIPSRRSISASSNTGVGRKVTAIEGGVNRLAGNR